MITCIADKAMFPVKTARYRTPEFCTHKASEEHNPCAAERGQQPTCTNRAVVALSFRTRDHCCALGREPKRVPSTSDLSSSSSVWALSKANVCGHKMRYWHHRTKRRTHQISLRKSPTYYQANQSCTLASAEPSAQKQHQRAQGSADAKATLATKESSVSIPPTSSSSSL